jgi:DNA-binding CsgD family transcriptional regulator
VLGKILSFVHVNTDELRLAPDLRVLDGVASWCGGLHGSMPLAEALAALARGLDASAAAISRHFHRTEENARVVALHSGDGPERMSRAYCQDVLDYQFGRARAGTVWFLSDMFDDPSWLPSRRLDGWLERGGAREIAVVPMAVTRQTTDYVEFHFEHELDRASQHEIEALVPTIERSWSGRKPGLVAMTISDGRTPLARSGDHGVPRSVPSPILGMSNPASLSRAEFRVCLLLSRGLSVKAVSDELGLSENTIRSHLRSIYSKTGSSSLPELLYLILTATEEAAQQDNIRARA